MKPAVSLTLMSSIDLLMKGGRSEWCDLLDTIPRGLAKLRLTPEWSNSGSSSVSPSARHLSLSRSNYSWEASRVLLFQNLSDSILNHDNWRVQLVSRLIQSCSTRCCHCLSCTILLERYLATDLIWPEMTWKYAMPKNVLNNWANITRNRSRCIRQIDPKLPICSSNQLRSNWPERLCCSWSTDSWSRHCQRCSHSLYRLSKQTGQGDLYSTMANRELWLKSCGSTKSDETGECKNVNGAIPQEHVDSVWMMGEK